MSFEVKITSYADPNSGAFGSHVFLPYGETIFLGSGFNGVIEFAEKPLVSPYYMEY